MRLTENLSIRYSAELDYLPQVVEAVQFEHTVLLRAAWTLL